MKHKRIRLSAALLIGLGLTGLHAQETIPASGGDASGNGGSVSYSIGQMVYTTNTGTNGSAAQGVQQPYEISIISGIKQSKDINLTCTVYPNPAVDLLTLKVDNYNFENLMYRLYDVNGRLIENRIIESNETSISMRHLVPATYFLKVTQVGKEIKTFKIIKN